jgi:hypothetical protein
MLLPLGTAWTGTCHANAAEPMYPDDSELRRLCNLGYARGVCPRFPIADPGPDAVRFTLNADDETSLRIYYVLERDHQPFAHGPLEFVVGRRSFASPPVGGLTASQGAAYAACYLQRKAAASE